MTALSFLLLALSILCEVTATVCLRMATAGGRTWWVGVVLGLSLIHI